MTGTSVAALLQRFSIYGRYYSLYHGARQFEMRSHLEIFEVGRSWRQIVSADADLIAIMMNPGGSRPLAPPEADGWAPAVPDRTQYQLMKLALHAQARGMRLSHIRVINLSDLRTPKSAELFTALRQFQDHRHSVFGGSRQAELARALGAKHIPVLRAWGLAPALKPLAAKAVECTASRVVLGLTDNSLAYRHPLPQRADFQQAWLTSLSLQVDRLVAG